MLRKFKGLLVWGPWISHFRAWGDLGFLGFRAWGVLRFQFLWLWFIGFRAFCCRVWALRSWPWSVPVTPNVTKCQAMTKWWVCSWIQ